MLVRERKRRRRGGLAIECIGNIYIKIKTEAAKACFSLILGYCLIWY